MEAKPAIGGHSNLLSWLGIINTLLDKLFPNGIFFLIPNLVHYIKCIFTLPALAQDSIQCRECGRTIVCLTMNKHLLVAMGIHGIQKLIEIFPSRIIPN